MSCRVVPVDLHAVGVEHDEDRVPPRQVRSHHPEEVRVDVSLLDDAPVRERGRPVVEGSSPRCILFQEQAVRERRLGTQGDDGAAPYQPPALLGDAVHAGAREPVYIESLAPGLAGGAERRIVLPDDGQLVVHP